MPLHRFECKQCEVIFSIFMEIGKGPPFFCDQCKKEMKKIPSAPSTLITERSATTKKSVKRGINEELRKRSHEHFQNHEAPDLIEEHGMKMAKDMGWVDPKTGKKRNLIDEK